MQQGQKPSHPDQPFFLYFAPGATHAPHHVPKEWIDKFKGQFDMGWDRYREDDLRAAEGSSASFPQDAKLTPRPTGSRPGTRSTPTRSGSTRG